MKRLEIQYRGKIVNMALPGAGVLSAIVTVADRSARRPESKDNVSLRLGGLDSNTNEHVEWDTVDLVPGDTVQITVHDDGEADPPKKKRSGESKHFQEFTKQRVRSLAAELDWTIIESPQCDSDDS